jgi:hypothetical protein
VIVSTYLRFEQNSRYAKSYERDYSLQSLIWSKQIHRRDKLTEMLLLEGYGEFDISFVTLSIEEFETDSFQKWEKI